MADKPLIKDYPMPRTATVLSIFVSSPIDVKDDRSKVLSAISAWNQRNGNTRGIFFNPLTWEQVVAPDRGDGGQNVIDEQIGADYDIYLGLMWSRFGTSTGNADSGTEDEFNQAIERHDQGEAVTISFLFNGAPIPQAQLNGEQYDKIQTFKRKVGELGCLYREYSDDVSLVEAINLILDRAANKKGAEVENGDASESTEFKLSAQMPLDNELGLIDLNEILEREGTQFAELMADWGSRLGGVKEAASTATDELNSISRFGQIEPKAAKKIINSAAEATETFVDWGEESQNEIDRIIERFSNAYTQIINISEDFDLKESDIHAAILEGQGLLSAISSTNESLESLSETTLSMPRISKELIRSNKRLSALLSRIVQKNRTFATNIDISMKELSQRSGIPLSLPDSSYAKQTVLTEGAMREDQDILREQAK